MTILTSMGREPLKKVPMWLIAGIVAMIVWAVYYHLDWLVLYGWNGDVG